MRFLSRPAALLSLAAALAFSAAGCKRSNSPLLSTPSSSVSSVSMSIPQIDTSHAPEDRIFLSVRDASDNPLTDFKIGNFSILEAGRPGVPHEVGIVPDALFLALVLDRSGSMLGGRTTAANTAAVSLINSLGASDSAALIEFANSAALTVDFTTDKNALDTAINAGAANGGTALYDAVVTGANLLNGKPGRRLLLVLTDGDDNSSSATLGEAIDMVNKGGLSCYTVGLGSGVKTDALTALAVATGASYYSSTDGSDLTTVFLKILNQINNLVYLKYRRRAEGEITVYLNYGSLTASAKKPF